MTGLVQVALTHGFVAEIDADCSDRMLVCEFHDRFIWTGRVDSIHWRASRKKHTTYAVAHIFGEREIFLHRAIMGACAGQIVDHRDGNGLNCRRENLRVTDHFGNARNRVKGLGTSSKYKGVSFHKATGRWSAYVKFERRKRHLGTYFTEEEAARAYDAAAIRYFGEFARLNFPVSGAA